MINNRPKVDFITPRLSNLNPPSKPYLYIINLVPDLLVTTFSTGKSLLLDPQRPYLKVIILLKNFSFINNKCIFLFRRIFQSTTLFPKRLPNETTNLEISFQNVASECS